MTDRRGYYNIPYRAQTTERAAPVPTYIRAHPTCQQCRKMQAEIIRLTSLLSEGIDRRATPKPHWHNSWADMPDEMSPRRIQNTIQKSNSNNEQKLRNELSRLQHELRLKSAEVQELRKSNKKEENSKRDSKNPAKYTNEFDKSKVSEMYNALYEKEWKATYSLYLDKGNVKGNTIENLRTILETAFTESSSIADAQLDNILVNSSVTNNRGRPNTQTTQQLSTERKNMAVLYRQRFANEQVSDVQSVVFPKVIRSVKGKGQLSKEEAVKNFVNKCIEVTWYISTELQSLSLDTEEDRFSEFDTVKYDYFSEEAENIDYIVWPAIVSDDNDNFVVVKGVAQATDQKS